MISIFTFSQITFNLKSTPIFIFFLLLEMSNHNYIYYTAPSSFLDIDIKSFKT